MAIEARIEAFGEAWRAARESGDEARIEALRIKGQAIAAEVQAAEPAPDGAGDVDRIADLDGAISAAVNARADVVLKAWRTVPVPDVDDPIPPDVQATIGAFLERWQAAPDEAERDGLADEAAGIGAGLRGGGADSEGRESLRAAVDAAVAQPGSRQRWESIPKAPRRATAADGIKGGFPDSILGIAGTVPGSDREWGGAVVSVGTVAVLSGEGSVAKSGLTCDLAIGIASKPDGFANEADRTLHDIPGGLFRAQGGPVLMVTYEDLPSVTAWKLQGAAKERGVNPACLARVHVLDMEGQPLFGPPEPEPARDGDGEIIGEGRGGLYNARPAPLPGWFDLWREVERVNPVLVIIDPALAAYVGDSAGAAPVREFITALIQQARKHDCGVLVVAHSTKAARGGGDPDPLDPGHVSGSAAWFDAARGVLVMQFAKDSPPDEGIRTLSLPKVNYGHGRIGCSIEPVRLSGGAIVGFDLVGSWEHLTATQRGEREARPERDGRPYHHAGAVIDAVRVLVGKDVPERKEAAIQDAAWQEARAIVKQFPAAGDDGKAALKEARRRYGVAKETSIPESGGATAYREAKGEGPKGSNRGGNGAAGQVPGV